jgi:hypothetical protein
VAIYKSHPEAEAAIKELQQSGFDMKKLSIVGRDYHTDEHVVGYYTTGDRMKYWGGVGAFWGWIWGCLFGSALFVIPGVGPLLLAGPVVGWLLGALGEAVLVGGLSALGAALFSQGIPKNSVLKYESARGFASASLAFRDLPADGPYIQTLLAWRRDNQSPILANFLRIVRSATV